MNKLYISLLISAGIILVITILVYILLPQMNYTVPRLFVLLPAFSLSMMSSLAMLVKQYTKKERPMEVGEILGIRMLFLVPFIGLLIAGILMNRTNIALFVILFVIYYVVFAVIETRTLIKLTKKEI